MNKIWNLVVATLLWSDVSLLAQSGAFQFVSQGRLNEVREDAGPAQIDIMRKEPTGGAASVRVRTVDRTATAGVDYGAINEVVSFAPNESRKTIVIPIFADGIFEGNERFRVELSEPSGAVLARRNVAESIIINDAQDDPPNDDFASAQSLSGRNGALNGTNKGASREPGEPSHLTPRNRSVWYNYTAPGDGLAKFRAEDRKFASLLAVYVGNSVGALDLQRDQVDTDDPEDSDDRTVTIQVQAGGVYRVAVDDLNDPEDSDDREDSDDSDDGHGKGGRSFLLKWKTILPGSLQFSSATYFLSETSLSAEITVLRTGGKNREVSVEYATRNGTAVDGEDYTGTSGVLTFAEGEKRKTFSIPILDDTLFEQPKTVRLTLSNPTGGAKLGLSHAKLTIENDDPFTPGAGKYTALASPALFANAATGRASLKVGALGTMTGKLSLGGVTYRLKGAFDGLNHLVITKGRGSLPDLVINLQLTPDGSEISGTVSDGSFTAEISGDRNGYDATNDPAPQKGRYTVSLPGDDLNAATGFPKGDGWAKMKVSADGIANVVGVLADGTAISTSLSLAKTGEAPLYVPLYSKKGSLSGRIVFAGNPGVSDAAGTLHWHKPANLPDAHLYPAGFSIDLPFVSSAYGFTDGVRVLAGLDATQGQATIIFGEGNLTDDLSQAVNLGFDNVLSLS